VFSAGWWVTLRMVAFVGYHVRSKSSVVSKAEKEEEKKKAWVEIEPHR
jgi:hypothetical protein